MVAMSPVSESAPPILRMKLRRAADAGIDPRPETEAVRAGIDLELARDRPTHAERHAGRTGSVAIPKR